MSSPFVLVLGTQNRKKARELISLLEPHGFQLLTLADFPDAVDVEETGETFLENAQLKATQQAGHLEHWVLGEDSGIVVDALDGRPGVYSARYSGPDATDASNNQLLLEELGSTPNEKREAHYVCHVSLADPSGDVRVDCEEYCRGRIGKSEAGANGFGYDPLFEIVEYHRTFGELSEAVKSVLSHRARALRRIVPKLLAIASAGEWVRNDR